MAHRLRGVEHQVEKGLLDQARISVDLHWPRRGLESQVHAVKLGLREKEIDHLLAEAVEFNGLAVQLDPAGVAKEIIQNVAQAAGFALAGVEAIGEAREGRVVGRKVFLEKLKVQLNRGEGVLDLVRESAGESAQLGQPFGILGAALEA